MTAGAGSSGLTLRCVPFSRAHLWDEIRRASSFASDDTNREPPDQASYLASYLDHVEAGARSLVIEKPYVDRHYLEEYSGYYATSLRPPSSSTTRVHVFRAEVDEPRIRAWIEDAAKGKAEYQSVCRQVTDQYLGFIVVRPVPAVPIGRTILRTYGEESTRCYGPKVQPHRVHLAGLELTVEGVPFQQQDQAVGACATTAVWSALARVIRADGGRATTPLAVTTAANKHVLSGRPLPASSGLELAQMLSAIREFGYSPEVLKPEGEFSVFVIALKCYLASGIPVILQIKPSNAELHAITLTGFRAAPGEKPLEVRVTESRVLRAWQTSRLYAHDDRLGPYARMKWVPPEAGMPPELAYWPYESGFESFEQPAKVWTAIVPLYPKIRLCAEDLIEFAGQLLPLMQFLAGSASASVVVDFKFALGGQYLRDLYARGLPAERLFEISTHASLSRYVGVIGFSVGDAWLADVICDTTDIKRAVPQWAPILAIVPRRDDLVPELRKLADTYRVEAIIA